MSPFIDEFIFSLEKERTLKRSSISRFKKLLQHVDSYIPLETITRESFEAFVQSKREQGLKASYTNDYRTVIRKYARFKGIQELIDIPDEKEEVSHKEIFSDEEILKFLSLPPSRKGEKEAVGYDRWTIFYTIMAFSSLRCGEVAKLRKQDIKLNPDEFILRDTKTHDTRNVPIMPNIKEMLLTYMETCDDYLFPSRRGGNKDGLGAIVDNVDWHYNFHSRLKRLGIKRQGLTPYSLRHTALTRLVDEDVALPKIMLIAGHKRLQTTMQYIHLSTKTLHEAMRKDRLVRDFLSPTFKVQQEEDHILAALKDDPRFDIATVKEAITLLYKSVKQEIVNN